MSCKSIDSRNFLGLLLALVLVILSATIGEAGAAKPRPIEGLYQLDDSAIHAAYPTKGYDWENNALGISEQVPEPWTPVTYTDKTLTCWGRVYQFADGLLPVQIQSQGFDLFSKSPLIDLVVGGKRIEDRQVKTRLVSQTDAQVVLQSVVEKPNLRLVVNTMLEFDGFIRFDFSIIPKKTIVIDRFKIDFRIHQAVSKYYSRFLNYRFNKIGHDRKDTLHATNLINKDKKFPFAPTIWIGNEKVGFEWISETDIDIHVSDTNKVLQIQDKRDYVLFSVNYIDYPVKLSNKLTYSFALLPTPIKRMLKDWRSYVMIPSMSGKKAQKRYGIPKYKDKKILYFGNYATIPLAYPGLPLPATKGDKKKKYHENRKSIEEDNIIYMPYSALYMLPNTIPELAHYRARWESNASRAGALNWRKYLGTKKAAQPISFHHKSQQDFLLYKHHTAIRQNALKAMYFDYAVMNEIAGLTRKKYGRSSVDISRKRYYPMYAHRNFLKRYWIMVKALHPDFVIVHHDNKVPYINTSYADFLVEGETFNILFRVPADKAKKTQALKQLGNRESEKFARYAWKDPKTYVPDYLNLPENLFPLGFLQNSGSVKVVLPQILKFNSEFLSQNEPLYRAWTRRLLGLCLVYDIPFWHTRLHGATLTGVMDSIDKFGGLHNAETVSNPFNLPESLKELRSASLRLSAFIKQDKLLIFMLNRGGAKKTFKLEIPGEWLRPEEHVKTVVNAETGQPLVFKDRAISVHISAKNFVMLLVHLG